MDHHTIRKVSRRRFLKKSALGASALAVPAFVSSDVLGNDDAVRIGSIGCGGRGSRDLQALASVGGARIVAVCELRDDRLSKAKQIAQKSKPTGYKDFRRMMDKEKLDGVTAVVEVQNHAKVVVPILEAGYNCFSEKPMDNTVEKVDAIVRAARKANRWVQFGFQRRYIAGHRKVVADIHKGELGPIYALQGHWHFSNVGGRRTRDADWDGGRLIEQACHHMDAMNWVMKNQAPLRCIAMAMGPSDPGPNPPTHLSETKSSVAFEFPGNVLFSYSHLFGMPGPFGDQGGNNFNGEKLWVVCERGGYDLTQGMKYNLRGGQERIGEPSNGYYDGTREQFVSFAECLRTGTIPDSNHETARISTLMSIMGRKAMYNRETRSFTPRLIRWEDLGSTT